MKVFKSITMFILAAGAGSIIAQTQNSNPEPKKIIDQLKKSKNANKVFKSFDSTKDYEISRQSNRLDGYYNNMPMMVPDTNIVYKMPKFSTRADINFNMPVVPFVFENEKQKRLSSKKQSIIKP